jgi:hypothetical protein
MQKDNSENEIEKKEIDEKRGWRIQMEKIKLLAETGLKN